MNTGERKMITKTIKQKASNTGTIYDIASQHYDIVLQFDLDENYAILYPSYLNREAEYYETLNKANENVEDYGNIVDIYGNIYAHVGFGEFEIIDRIIFKN